MRRLLPVIVVVTLAGCGGGGNDDPATTAATTPPPTAPASPPAPEAPGEGLAIGINEANPNVINPARGDGAFVPWAERFKAMKPHVGRVIVDWAGLQPDPGRAAQLAGPRDGCLRTTPPCAPYAGIRDQLRAYGDLDVPVMVVFYGVPEWAAARAKGCERPGIEPRSRPITDRGLIAYKALIYQVADAARKQGADVRWWSVWNEPNGPFFISPQRNRCSVDSPPVSVKPYVRLARAMRAAIGELDGNPKLVVGEFAGIPKRGPRGTAVGEFLRKLPADVLCEADVLALHQYAELPEDAKNSADPVGEARAALGEKCPGSDLPFWITETGVGGPHAGDNRPTGVKSLRRQCIAYQRKLLEWHADPQIQVAIQYTFREDTAFPVGLVDAGLTRTYPTYDLIAAWGNRKPGDPPAPAPASCKA